MNYLSFANIYQHNYNAKACQLICKTLVLLCTGFLFSCVSSSSNTNSVVTEVNFWNGNKSTVRQKYELDMLNAALLASSNKYGPYHIQVSYNNYDGVEGEANVFRVKKYDLFATPAGNPKLQNEKKRIVPVALMKGILGYRIAIIREEMADTFKGIFSAEQLQALNVGIPDGWGDAKIFKANKYGVTETGTYADIFTRLLNKEFDYFSLGANEVESAFMSNAAELGGLTIDDSLVLYYPFPVVFYVNPVRNKLADRLQYGLQIMIKEGTYDKIFAQYFGDKVASLKLKERNVFRLNNPVLHQSMQGYQSTLLR